MWRFGTGPGHACIMPRRAQGACTCKAQQRGPKPLKRVGGGALSDTYTARGRVRANLGFEVDQRACPHKTVHIMCGGAPKARAWLDVHSNYVDIKCPWLHKWDRRQEKRDRFPSAWGLGDKKRIPSTQPGFERGETRAAIAPASSAQKRCRWIREHLSGRTRGEAEKGKETALGPRPGGENYAWRATCRQPRGHLPHARAHHVGLSAPSRACWTRSAAPA